METQSIRLVRSSSFCFAPQILAEPFLRREGFTHVQFVDRREHRRTTAALRHLADITLATPPEALLDIDRGEPVVLIAGVHAGCWELFAHAPVKGIRDLKGRSVAIRGPESSEQLFLASILALIGIDSREIRWVHTQTQAEAAKAFAEERVDAILAFPPQTQILRAQGVGRVLVNTALDRPWSQYFCCMVAANREYVQQHPIATRLALRALLKAADFCAREPQRAATLLTAAAPNGSAVLAETVLREVRYDRWREFNPEDTVRFHALRQREAGLVQSTPDALIEKGTDWSSIRQLNRELKS